MTAGEKIKLKTGLLFISPWIAGFIIFTVYTVCASFYYSFCDYDVFSKPIFIGFTNYSDLAQDSVFWKALYNTVIFAIFAIPLGLIVSISIAILLNMPVSGRPFFRTLFFLPSLVPLVATAMIWLWIFNGKYGLLNYFLSLLGLPGPEWLTDEKYTKPALILTVIWGVGHSVVIYLAALQDVPIQLYESAEIDGAGFLRKVWHITIPSISPVIYFNLIMGIIGCLQVFSQPYIMFGGGNGGPNRSALFYAVYLYENAFSYNQMGYACAMAWILFVIIVSLTFIATKLSRKHVHYGE
ncbi:MAG TPA: sugar ABC transporter permease [Victivallales bacterium]|nr:sugar ABC transporter permease [Victivallales bacterium]HPO90320.1 sugar ABC transporter permease [Victivallales bacterium]HRU00752.1 sugar ABC transporter permease [Victivallales bacterium]